MKKQPKVKKKTVRMPYFSYVISANLSPNVHIGSNGETIFSLLRMEYYVLSKNSVITCIISEFDFYIFEKKQPFTFENINNSNYSAPFPMFHRVC